METQKDWIAAIVVFYIVFVVISSLVDSLGEKFTDNVKVTIHLIVILIIIIGTIYSFNTFLDPSKKVQPNITADDSLRVYKIAIPYVDNTLITHVGINNFVDKRLVFITTKKVANIDKARELAEDSFWSDKSTEPFSSKNSLSKKSVVIINYNNIVIEEE